MSSWADWKKCPACNVSYKDVKQPFTTPLCTLPFVARLRSSILSGRYLHNGGALNYSIGGNCNGKDWQTDAELQTFAVYAKQAGYHTSFAGKYLNEYGGPITDCRDKMSKAMCPRVPPGWEQWLGLVGNSRYYNYSLVQSLDGGQTTEVIHHGNDYATDYLPDVLANFTLATMKIFLQHDNDTPILMVLSWPTAHAPFTPAPWAVHAFDGRQAPRTTNWNASHASLQSKHWMMRWLAPIDADLECRIDQIYENRLESLLSVDRHIRQLVKLLEEFHQWKNTWVLYTSDNGFQLGQHRLGSDKRQLYEHDIRVPFIVTGPGVPSNTHDCDHIVMNIDIAPTIYHLVTGTSSPLPANMD
jgi:N-acetylglucosamine-6-sulfatase